MTPYQQVAIEQLNEIQRTSRGKLRVRTIRVANKTAFIEISFYCGGMSKVKDGLPLRVRERFTIRLRPDYPYHIPLMNSVHTRFYGFPHVQWGSHLCLYQSSAIEWNGNDGMFGFIERLEFWLKQGAVNQLDPIGLPLHPPVAYASSGIMVITRVDTPTIVNDHWLGVANIQSPSNERVDIVGWAEKFKDFSPLVAPTVLLTKPMPFEYPAQAKELIDELVKRGVDRELLLIRLQMAIFKNPKDSRLFIIVGTPQRGIAGSGNYKQNLQVWCLSEKLGIDTLRLSLASYSSNPEMRKLGAEVEELLWKWLETAKVAWCSVREARPEIVTRRDHGTPVSWFQGKAVSLWGCGAIGGYLAEFLVRASVRKIILRDNGDVAPGLLARQAYYDEDIGKNKAKVLGERLSKISASVEILTSSEDVLELLDKDDWTDGADILIDASASENIRQKVELKRRFNFQRKIPIACMFIDGAAQRGLSVLAGKNWTGGSQALVRKAKIEACENGDLKNYLESFWPVEKTNLFQPEPGCSDPTFIGSASDASALAGMMLNRIGNDLRNQYDNVGVVHFVTQVEEERSKYLTLRKEVVCQDQDFGYEIRIDPLAWEQAVEQARNTSKKRGRLAETGGLLFGEANNVTKIIWISDIGKPPADSKASPEEFECGIAETEKVNLEKEEKYRASIRYLGLWHSHPDGAPTPSQKDITGVEKVLAEGTSQLSRILFLIMGTVLSSPTVGVFIVSRADFEKWKSIYENKLEACSFLIERLIRGTSADQRGRKKTWRWPCSFRRRK